MAGVKAVKLEYMIETEWDGGALEHDPVCVTLTPGQDRVKLEVKAPFFDDPPPGGEPGKPFMGLWDYEVVEAFFLNDKDQYLEVEFCPHGQHLVLTLDGCKKQVEKELALEYSAKIEGDTWHGEAFIPASYFPPSVTRFNAFAIHGTGFERWYEALYPIPKGKRPQPDFHDLEVFKPIDFKLLLPENDSAKPSQHWT